MNDFVGILLGTCMEYVPENYREIVLAIATPVYVGIILIFTFWLFCWGCRSIYKAIVGGDDK